MSERPKALEISAHLEERLRKKLIEQLTELARPFLDWDLDENKPSPESKTLLTSLTQDELLGRVRTEGFRRKNLLELAQRITDRRIDIRDIVEENEMADHTVCFHIINELAITKLNAAALYKSTGKKDSDERFPDEIGVRVAIEHYAQESLITQEDINKNGSTELQQIVQGVESDPIESRRIQWKPSIPPDAQVTLAPPGLNPKNVNPTGPTQAVPVFPPVDPTGFAGSSEPIASGYAPTIAIAALGEESGPTAISPAASSNPPPSMPQLSTGFDSAETPDDVMPVIFLTDGAGNPLSNEIQVIPLFQKRSAEDAKGYAFSIGSHPSCDIQFEKEEHPYVTDFHAEIRIEENKAFIKSKKGAIRIVGRGQPIIHGWEEIAEGEVIKLIPQLSNGVSPYSMRKEIHFRIEPNFGMFDGENKTDLRQTLRDKAEEIIQYRDEIIKKENDGPSNALALGLGEMLRDLMEFDIEHKIGALTQELQQKILDHFHEYNRSVEKIIDEVREAVNNGVSLEIGIEEKERLEKGVRERRESAIAARAKKAGVKILHIGEDEDPETITHVFACPVYYLRPYMSDQKSIPPIPMISPKIALGTSKICHVQLEKSDKTSARKHHVAKFMAKLLLNEEGGKYHFSVKYLHENVRIRADGGKIGGPPRETFEIEPGMGVELGPYTLTVDEEPHGFSYNQIKDQLNTIINKHLDRIENQDITTSVQDEESYQFIRAILEDIKKSDLPQEIKDQISNHCQQRLEGIFTDLWAKICNWDDENPEPDSGYFQTILMLVDKTQDRAVFGTDNNIMISRNQVENTVLSRAEIYARTAKKVERGLSRVTAAIARISRGDDAVKAEHEHLRNVAENGVVEIARFIEFGLVQLEQLPLFGAPKSYCESVKQVLEIRRHFAKLDKGREAQLEEILQLYEMGENKCMDDIFAPEEIHTRNLHIEVNMEAGEPLRKYIQKMAVFVARKTYKRIDTNKSPEEVLRDTRLIEGLAEAGIMKLIQLLDDQKNLQAFQDLEDIVERKAREASTKQQAAVQSEMVKKLEEEEINRLVEYAAAIHETLVKSRKGINLGSFMGMLNIAHIALDPQLQKLMSRRDYDIYIDSMECIVRTDSSRTGATQTRINWRRYFQEWEQRLNQFAGIFAKKVCRGEKNAAEYAQIIRSAVAKGYVAYESIGVTEHELTRGIEANKFIYARETVFPLENIDYLSYEPRTNLDLRDEQYWDAVKAQVTNTKLEGMFQEWRAGNKKLFYERKIKKLQRQDARAIEMFNSLNPSNKERDLLQISK